MPADCCELWDEENGICVHEICPGCYCTKAHDQNVCVDCHTFNLNHEPYLAKYGPENVRTSASL
jgi:hypothetical protein